MNGHHAATCCKRLSFILFALQPSRRSCRTGQAIRLTVTTGWYITETVTKLYTTQAVRGEAGPGLPSRYSDSLRAGRSGDRIPVGGEIFRTRPDRPWGPPSLLYNGYRVFPGGKAAGAWCWPPTPSSAEIKESVELYLYSTSGPSWPVIGWPLSLPFMSGEAAACN